MHEQADSKRAVPPGYIKAIDALLHNRRCACGETRLEAVRADGAGHVVCHKCEGRLASARTQLAAAKAWHR